MSERIQLHSGFGRLLLLFVSGWFWLCLADAVFVWGFSIYRHQLGPAELLISMWTLGAFFLSRWAGHNATPVFATAAGLELTNSGAIVAWRSVTKVQYLALLSSLVPVYRISFANQQRALTFYACEDVEHVVARFKAAAQKAA